MASDKMNMYDMAKEFDARGLKVQMAKKYGEDIANMAGTLLSTSLLQREVKRTGGMELALKMKMLHVSMVGELAQLHAQKKGISEDEFMMRSIQCAEEIEAAADNFARAAAASGKMAEEVVTSMQNKAG